MKKVGLYAGSFDPFTVGHLAIVCKALGSYDEIIIGVGINPDKKGMFNIAERDMLAKNTINDLIESYDNRHVNGKEFTDYEVNAIEKIKINPNVIKTIHYDDLTIDAAIRNGATSLIRGERDAGDTVEEMRLESMNNALAKVRGVDISTNRIKVPKEGLTYVSSSSCKNLCACGEYIAAENFVSPSVHHELMKKYLYEEFKKLGKHFNVNKKSIDAHFNKLINHYSKGRYYHNLTHIAYSLNQINIYEKSGKNIPNIEAMKVAMFYHDIVNASEKDDEIQSAKMAALFMKNADKKDQVIVEKCILATNHREDKEKIKMMSTEEKIISDIDLIIFSDTDNFGTYAQNVRKEYSRFDDATYAKGRVAVLQKFLNKNNIYKTEHFMKFERKAKDNIHRERGHWLGVLQDKNTKVKFPPKRRERNE